MLLGEQLGIKIVKINVLPGRERHCFENIPVAFR
jgi:hypothetical protein